MEVDDEDGSLFFFCFLFVSLDRGMFEDVELFPSSLFFFLPRY